jgi:hypothetical protein
MKILTLALLVVLGLAAVGCGGPSDEAEKLPPAKFQPDPTQPPSKENPANSQSQAAL